MAAPRRTTQPPQQQPQYAPVPQNPSYINSPQLPQSPVGSSQLHQQPLQQQQRQYQPSSQLLPPSEPQQEGRGSSLGRRDTAHGVAKGAIGGAFGPYAYHQSVSNRDSGLFADSHRFSAAMSDESSIAEKRGNALAGNTSTVPAYLYDTKDPDLDDALHNPDPVRDARLDRSFDPFSLRGWLNVGMLVLLVGGLITLFAGFPIIQHFTSHGPSLQGAFNLGGTNSSGQIPSIPGVPSLIDKDTPAEAQTRKGYDGMDYTLVFSDEFNTDGRTFWPGDDPYWEAVDLYYWPTADLEWYHPSAITTQNGKLVITMTEVLQHNLNWQSGMLQSWNKFCFTTGYIEVSISLPGSGDVPGNWAAAWTMGNLGRAGFGATTDGMWPYSYAACDLGTFPNQTKPDGSGPAAALDSGDPRPPTKGAISFLPGQRVSACTCPGDDHPGPNVGVGRGVPEIDIIEAQVDIPLRRGQASQSAQVAPFNAAYQFNNQSTVQYNTAITAWNGYKGGSTQQAISSLTLIDNANYNDNGYQTYGFEYHSDPSHRDQGYVTWYIGADTSWTMNAGAVGPDSDTQVDQRLVSEEPMSIILNFGMSPGFQGADFANLKFPQHMYVDYVRVYQRTGQTNVGCDPPGYPTADYINNHLVAYTNANITRWNNANFSTPRNSLYNGC